MASYQKKALHSCSSAEMLTVDNDEEEPYMKNRQTWESTLRLQIDHSILADGRPQRTDIIRLLKKTVKLIVAAIQPNSCEQAWHSLVSALELIEPYSKFLGVDPGQELQTQHYIERLYIVFQKESVWKPSIPLLDCLEKVFPKELSEIQEKYAALPDEKSLCWGSEKMTVAGRKWNQRIPGLSETHISSLLPASHRRFLDKKTIYTSLNSSDKQPLTFDSTPLTFGDLRNSVAVVSLEAAAQSSGKQATGTLDVSTSRKRRTDLCAWLRSANHSCEGGYTPIFHVPIIGDLATRKDFKSITGREAVELFTAKKHLNVVHFMYLNFARTRHYRPYDLVSVPQDKVDPEHFIFSTFGVLHVFPDGSTSETMSLSQWNRMALLWNIVSNIKFFKHFLILKSWKQWRYSIRRQRLIRTRTYLENNLIHTVPEFGIGLVHIMRLVSELSDIQLLPDESSKIRNESLSVFAVAIAKRESEIDKLLGTFFGLCQEVVDTTRKECFDHLRCCEYQFQNQKNFFSKESLYIQRRKRAIQRMNLEKARQAVKQLSTFISLTNQIVKVHLLDAVRSSVQGFVYGVICPQNGMTDESIGSNTANSVSPNIFKDFPSIHSTTDNSSKHAQRIPSEGSVFLTKLEFQSRNLHLTMYPSPDRFRSLVSSCISSMIVLLCNKEISKEDRVVSHTDYREMPSFHHSCGTTNSSHSSLYPYSPSQKTKHHVDSKVPGEFSASDALVEREKEENLFGLATQNLAMASEADFGLMVTGRAVFGHYFSIDETNLKIWLETDQKILEALDVQNTAIDKALVEVEEFCNKQNAWLVPVKEFTVCWHAEDLKRWRSKPAYEIENMLNQVKQWIDKIKNMEQIHLCKNRLLLVDCKAPQAELIATLTAIFKQVAFLISDNAKDLSLDVTNTSKEAIEALENKDLNIESFASYVLKVAECQQVKSVMSEKVKYIRELHEVIRLTYRQLTHDEEKLEDKVKSAWETFIFQLKDASNFVFNQQPLILKQLDDLFTEKYAYAKKLSELISSYGMMHHGKHPQEVILKMVNICSKFSSVQRKLHEINSWRQAIEGKCFDLTELSCLARVMDARLELWKYVNFSNLAIDEWKNTQFRKFDAKTATDKVLEWKQSSVKFQELLGGRDPVLQKWLKLLSNYEAELPLLQKLSDQALKNRHWKWLFTGLGQKFEPGWVYTVKDLLLCNLPQHANLVNQVCHGAIAEYTLEQILQNVKEEWESKQFHLAKHIYKTQKEIEEYPSPKVESVKGRKCFRMKEQKSNIYFPPRIAMKEVDSGTFVHVEAKDLLNNLASSQVTLQSILQSRHSIEVRPEAELWSDTLKQISEIVNLWTSCQDKWMYLHMVYRALNLSSQFREQILLFEDMDRRYREFVKTVVVDPKVLSVLSRRHGQKGWRELQGENLRKHIQTCIRMQDELLIYISHLLEEYRSDFPRMYFLTDEDCVQLVAVSRQPKSFTPYVLKCFTGVKSLSYHIPKDGQDGGIALGHDLNSHRLQVTKIQGKNGEFLEFAHPITMQTNAICWMKSFESQLIASLKNSLVELICHQKTGVAALETILEGIHSRPSAVTSKHWMLKYPVQIILLCGSITWTNEVYTVVSSQKHWNYVKIQADLNGRIEQYSQILMNCPKFMNECDRNRIFSVAAILTAQILHLRDVVEKFQEHSVSSVSAFEWQRIIKHSMEIPFEEVDFVMKSKPVAEINCMVEHMGTAVAKYGFEYVSCHLDGDNDSQFGTPYVITPLTDRFLFALSIAYDIGKCGTLFGPENVGKSALILHLARIFGRPLTNINCSRELAVPILLRALYGMIESSGFLCFDQVQRLPTNIMSCLIQNIRNIQIAFSMLMIKSQYIQHQCNSCQSKFIRRSNSVPSLHSVDEDAVKDSSKPFKWKPEIDQFLLSKINRHKEHDMKRFQAGKGGFGSIMFSGRLLRAQSRFGLFMTIRCTNRVVPEVPENLKLIHRPVLFIQPSMEKIAEMWLAANGFHNSVPLAAKISIATKIVTTIYDVSSPTKGIAAATVKCPQISLHDLRAIITESIANRTSKTIEIQNSCKRGYESAVGPQQGISNANNESTSRALESITLLDLEESCVASAVCKTFSKKFFSDSAIECLKKSLQELFHCLETFNAKDTDTLIAAAHQEFILNGLHASSRMVAKIGELDSALKQNKGILLIGPSGCGKTTICRLLGQVLNSISSLSRLPEQLGNGRLAFDKDVYSTKADLSGSHSFRTLQGIFRSVDISTIYPNILSVEDLFGFFENSACKVWKQGALQKILCDHIDESCYVTEVSEEYSEVPKEWKRLRRWIILDGEVTAPWIESVHCLLDINKSCRLPNLDKIKIPEETNIIFESTDLTNASPSLISRCCIVHCCESNLWKYVLISWINTTYGKYAITKKIVRIWTELTEDLFPRTLEFLQVLGPNVLNHGVMSGQQHCTSFGIHEATSFIHILSSLLDLHMDRKASVIKRNQKLHGVHRTPSDQRLISESSSGEVNDSIKSHLDDDIPEFHYQLSMNFFGFAFVWACGGKLLVDDMPRFDAFFRNLLSEARHLIVFPVYENVFEYFVDAENGEFTVWEDKIDLRPQVPPSGAYYSYIHHIERYAFTSSLLLKSNNPVLIMGKSGCGKSSMVSNLLKEEHEMTEIGVSSGMTPWHLQKLIESHSSPCLKQHNVGLMAHPHAVIDIRSEGRQSTLFFLDDLSRASNVLDTTKTQCSIQPVHELIRQVLCVGEMYDKEQLMMKSLESEVNFVGVATIPGAMGSGLGYSTHFMSPRFFRLFSVIHFLEPSKEAILSIYHNAVQSWLEEFPAYALTRHYELSQAIIAGAVEVYTSVSLHFKPSPRQPTYLFSLHDVSHVMKGLFMLMPCGRGRKLVRRRPRIVKEDDGQVVQRQRLLAGHAIKRYRTKEWEDPTLGGDFPMMRTVIRLWLHECSRTFYDRLTSDDDRSWFSQLLVQLIRKHFCTDHATTGDLDRDATGNVPVPSSMRISDSSSKQTTSVVVQDNGSSKAENFGHSPEAGKISSPSEAEESNGCTGSSKPNSHQNSVEVQSPQFLPQDKEKTMSSSTFTNLGKRFSPNDDVMTKSAIVDDDSQKSAEEEFSVLNSSVDTDDTEVESSLLVASTDLPMDYDDERQSVQTDLASEMDNTVSTSKQASEAADTKAQSFKSESSPTLSRVDVKETELPEIGHVPEPSRGDDLVPRNKRIMHTRPGGAKHGISFIPGLFSAGKGGISEPLVKFHQILSETEDPTSILFCKNVTGMKREYEEYCEFTEEQLTFALFQAQLDYNAKSPIPLELVFFQQTIEHAVRLCRVLSMHDGGHALCLSSWRFSGRRSVILLSSYLCKAVIVDGTMRENKSVEEIKSSSRRTQLSILVKDACMTAGIKNESTVLIVDEFFTSDVHCLDDICTLVKTGQYPSLYSHDDLVTFATEMSLNLTRSKDQVYNGELQKDKLDLLLHMYFKRVLCNLHVVLLMRCVSFSGLQDSSSFIQTSDCSHCDNYNELKQFHNTLKRCPEILTRFECVDIYQPWNHRAWVKIGQKFLLADTNVPSSDNSGNAQQIPWSVSMSRENQILKVSHVMSFIHQDVFKRVQDALPENFDRMVTPISFRTMIDSFAHIAIKTEQEEMGLLSRYEHALGKIAEAEGDLKMCHSDKESLLPRLYLVIENEKSWKRHVERERREFAEAKERCNFEEEMIEHLDEELSYFRQDAKVAFNELNPLYNVAMEAMQAMTVHGLDELKRYQKPPEGAKVVANVLCDLFEIKPASWENGKALLMRENFFEELEFFDKDNMPDHIYQALSKHIKDPEFQPLQVGKSSKAAESICTWVHALHSYAKLSRYLTPKIARVKEAESKLKRAQATLGAKRVRCNQIKEELDMKIQQHKDAFASVKKYQQDLKNLESKITKAQILMGNLAEYIGQWKQKRDTILSRANSAVGDSLLSAACMTYHSLLPKLQRELSLQKWRHICQHGHINNDSGELEILPQKSTLTESTSTAFIPLRSNLNPLKLMLPSWLPRNSIEVGSLKDTGMPLAVCSLIGLASHQQSSWPLIFDPDGELHHWMKDISTHYYNSIFTGKSRISSFEEEKTQASDDGKEEGNSWEHSWMHISEYKVSAESSHKSSTHRISAGNEHTERIQVKPIDEHHPLEDRSHGHIAAMNDLRSISTRDLGQSFPVKVVMCEADHVALNQKLEESIQNGYVIFVTNLERAEFPSYHHLLLLRYRLLHHSKKDDQFYLSGKAFSVHQNFRLFLSTSVTLKNLPRDGLLNLPLEMCCNIDFTMDADGLEEKLTSLLMVQEKPDFDNQHRLLKSDIFHLGQRCKTLRMELLTRVSSVGNSIFSDSSLLDTVRRCKQEITATDITLSEIKMMEYNLMQKTLDLSAVSKYCKVLYQAILQTSVLRRHLYHWTASSFIAMFCRTLKSTVRGKLASVTSSSHSASLSLKSRASEMNQNMLHAVLHVTKRSMFRKDYLAFIVILSFAKLHFENKVTQDEIFSFIFGFEKKKSGSPVNIKVALEKPPWMKEKAWDDVMKLQQKHSVFKGILESLSMRMNLWHEYLKAVPLLQANIPDDTIKNLNISQKALLWKTLRPDISDTICSKLSACVLSTAVYEQLDWRIVDLLEKTDGRCPVTFFIPKPSSGYVPILALLNIAKSLEIPTIERSAPLTEGVTKSLRKCMESGFWMIIHECDLQSSWPKDFMMEISSLYEESDEDRHRSIERAGSSSSSLSLENRLLDSNKHSESVCIDGIKTSAAPIHPHFRLFFVLKSDTLSPLGTNLPEIVIRKGLTINLSLPHDSVALMTQFFELLPQEECACTNNSQMCVHGPHMSRCQEADVDKIFKIQLSVLHTVLANSHVFWNTSFTSDLIDLYHLYHCSQMTGTICKRALCEEVLNIPSLGERQREILQLVVNDCLDLHKNTSEAEIEAEGIKEEFRKILSSSVSPIPYVKQLLKDELPERDQEQILKRVQFILRCSANSNFVIGNISTVSKAIPIADEACVEKRLEDIYNQTDIFESEGFEIVVQSGPISNFFQCEQLRQQTAIQLIRTDLLSCINAVKGVNEMNPYTFEILDDLRQNKLPRIWTNLNTEVFYFHSDTSVTEFVKNIHLMTLSFPSYRSKFLNFWDENPSSAKIADQKVPSQVQTSPSCNLAHFLRPDLFLKSLLAEFKLSSLRVEIISNPEPLLHRVERGSIIIEGIRLHGALFDTKSQSLRESPTVDTGHTLPPIGLTPMANENKANSFHGKKTFTCPVFHHHAEEEEALFNIPMRCDDDQKALQLKKAFAFLSL